MSMTREEIEGFIRNVLTTTGGLVDTIEAIADKWEEDRDEAVTEKAYESYQV